jgi:hypothetical protein
MTATGHLDPLHVFLIALVFISIINTPLHWR